MNPFARCQKDHPQRPPHWRWERARLVRKFKTRAPSRKGDDTWVGQATKLQAALEGAGDEVDVFHALDRAGPLGTAYEVWDGDSAKEGSGRSGSGLRAEVEARLLAGQPAEAIAARVGTSAEVLQAYEAVFFNVSDRLESTGWVIHQVIGPAIHRGMTDRDHDVLLRLFAYVTRDERVITSLVTTFDPSGTAVGDELGAFYAGDSARTLERKTALAMRMLPQNSFTQERMLELVGAVSKARAAAGEEGGAPAATAAKMLESLLGGLVWMVGPQAALPLHQKSGREPRASELLENSAAGKDVPVGDFVFPPPQDG